MKRSLRKQFFLRILNIGTKTKLNRKKPDSKKKLPKTKKQNKYLSQFTIFFLNYMRIHIVVFFNLTSRYFYLQKNQLI